MPRAPVTCATTLCACNDASLCGCTLNKTLASCSVGEVSALCCIHSCHGKGRCVDGACACDRGAGVDCGEVNTASRGRCPHGRRHGIYVGELGLAISAGMPTRQARPGVFGARECAAVPVSTIEPDANGIYAPLDVFLLRLLEDHSLRGARFGNRTRARTHVLNPTAPEHALIQYDA